MMKRIVIADVRVDDEHIDEHIGLWTLLSVPEDVVLAAAGFDLHHDSLAS